MLNRLNKSNGKAQKQALKLGQEMNAKLRQAKQEFEVREFENKSEDGLVSVVVTGLREIKSLSIDLPFVGDNKELLEGVVKSVVNLALSTVRDANIQLTEDVKALFSKG